MLKTETKCGKPAGEYCKIHNPRPTTISNIPEATVKPINQADINAFFKTNITEDIKEINPFGLITTIPATEYELYQTEVVRMLDTAGDIIADLPQNKKKANYALRDGSTSFEKQFLKPILFNNETKQQIINKINENNPEYELVNILDFKDSVKDETDAENRTFADIGLHVRNRKGQEALVAINIKATAGGTSDNVGGWSAFEFMMYGKNQDRATQRSTILERVTENNIRKVNIVSDYFLWSFTKGEKGKNQVFSKSNAVSLLEFDPNNFTFNANQSFPIQANVSRLVDSRHTLFSGLDKTDEQKAQSTLASRRVRLAKWILTKYDNYHEEQRRKTTNSLKHFS
jgi:hypothetical protein